MTLKTPAHHLEANRRWRAANLAYDRQRCRDRYAATREAALAVKRAYYQSVRKLQDKTDAGLLRDRERKARRRAQIKTDRVTPEEWAAILAASGHACAYCHRKDRPLEQDHVTPLSRRGRHIASNIVPACKPCNASKGAR